MIVQRYQHTRGTRQAYWPIPSYTYGPPALPAGLGNTTERKPSIWGVLWPIGIVVGAGLAYVAYDSLRGRRRFAR